MPRRFDRRALLAGVAAGAIALLSSSRALANTAFTSFLFAATGGSSSRTDPDRWADVKNVKDYGAKGDGVTDDTAAIQSAVNWTSGANRGTIYFPPGTYLVTSAITFNFNGALSIIFRGDGAQSALTGNFAGYILDRNLGAFNPTGGGRVIEKLSITNTNAAGGCIRMGSTVDGAIRDCVLSAFNCITFADSLFNSSQSVVVENCSFTSLGGNPAGSTGIYSGANTPVIGCDMSGFDTAIQHWGVALHVSGCRIEVNKTGIVLGKHPDGTTFASNAIFIGGTSFEANDNAISINALTGALLTSLNIIGSAGSPSGGSINGVNLPGGKASYAVFEGIVSAGGFSGSAFVVGGGCTGCVFESCIGSNGGTVWSMPGDGTVQFINCNNPTAAITFANLPASPVEGMEFVVSDCLAGNCGDGSCNTWGTTVTGGTGALRRKVYYNGTNWTVMAK